ncbi:MAG: hypothetical protein J5806_13525 [Lentisphaeria bacterium]|nr:hypothetical protein [Lentisphaeria bacterium]
MSLATVLTHLDDARDALAAALTEKGLTVSETITLNECADKIGDLPDVGAVDTSDADAVAGDILSGKTAYVNGSKITGSITSKAAATYTPTTNDQTIAAGQYLSGAQTVKGDPNLTAGNIKSGVTVFGVTGSHSGGTDTSDADAGAGDILSDKTAYVNGSKITGTIQTVTASLSANVATVPAGYIATAQTLTVAEAGAASVSDNVVTIPAGYIAAQRTVTVGTSKTAATYTPTTSDQTIASGQYLSGAQTVKGDANLVAANIADGVTIFGVTGTHSGGGSGAEFFKCLSERKYSYIVSGSSVTGVDGEYFESNTTYEGKKVYIHTNPNNGPTFYIVPIADPYGGSDVLQLRPDLNVDTEVVPQEGSGAYYVGEVLDPEEGYTWSYGSLISSGSIPTVTFSTYYLAAKAILDTSTHTWYLNDGYRLTSTDSLVIGKIYSATASSITGFYSVTGAGPVLYNFYKCASVNTTLHTWTGYLATLGTDQIYTFASTATADLTYDQTKTVPQIGKVYNDGALVEAKLYTGIPDPNLYFQLTDATESVTGAVLTNNGVTFGSTYAIFDGSSYFEMPSSIYEMFNSLTSIFFCGWFKLDSNAPSEQWLWAVGHGETDFGLYVDGSLNKLNMNTRKSDSQWGPDNDIPALVHDGAWHFCAFYSKSGGAQFACLDSAYQTNTNQGAFYTGTMYGGTIGIRDTMTSSEFLGDMAQFRFVFGETMTREQFESISAAFKAEFTPPSA